MSNKTDSTRAAMTARLLGEVSGPLMGIYVITHRATGKRYVGQSLDIARRWAEHRKGKESTPKLAAAVRKYGPDSFTFEIAELCAREELDDRECFYIFAFESLTPKGYNIGIGGGTVTFTPEVRAKMSESLRTSPSFRRRWADPEFRAKNAEANRILRQDPEWKKRVTEANRRMLANRWQDPEFRARQAEAVRRLHSDPEFRAKNAEANRRRADVSPYTIINIKTGQRDTGTRADFLTRYGIDTAAFSDLKAGRKKSARGWRLALPEEIES